MRLLTVLLAVFVLFSCGMPGRDGKDGKDSTVPGPQGPVGPQGPQGPVGPQGPGYSAKSTVCSAEWVMEYGRKYTNTYSVLKTPGGSVVSLKTTYVDEDKVPHDFFASAVFTDSSLAIGNAFFDADFKDGKAVLSRKGFGEIKYVECKTN
jgi:hypothetical protein